MLKVALKWENGHLERFGRLYLKHEIRVGNDESRSAECNRPDVSLERLFCHLVAVYFYDLNLNDI